MAVRNGYTGASGPATILPPWGADADVLIALGGRAFTASHRSPASFLFVGIGASGTDSLGSRVTTRSWSYGLGTTLPLGSIVDLFADSRWRMDRFVLPTATPKPERVKELRLGLALHAH
jgi:hypothetical protein